MECEASCVRPWLDAEDRLFVSGIGKVNAAAAAQRAIDAGASEVINIGLAGGFGAGVKLGGVYEVSEAVQFDFDLAQLNGTAIGVLDGYDSPYLKFSPTGEHPAKILATGDRFNDSDADFDLIENGFKAELADMEGAAIAQVCGQGGVCCRALKCVTNVAGCESMTGQYALERERCLALLAKAAEKTFSRKR